MTVFKGSLDSDYKVEIEEIKINKLANPALAFLISQYFTEAQIANQEIISSVYQLLLKPNKSLNGTNELKKEAEILLAPFSGINISEWNCKLATYASGSWSISDIDKSSLKDGKIPYKSFNVSGKYAILGKKIGSSTLPIVPPPSTPLTASIITTEINQDTPLWISDPIKIKFTASMEVNSVKNAFSLKRGDNSIETIITFSDNDSLITVLPKSGNLERGTKYTLLLATTAKSKNNQQLSASLKKNFSTSVFKNGNGTSASPYEIHTAADLDLIRGDYLKNHYKQANDIDLKTYIESRSKTDYPAGSNSSEGWLPIGDVNPDTGTENPFIGTYNGNNYKITGLYINRPAQSGIGLFSYIDNGSVTNLSISISDKGIKGLEYVGCIAGAIQNNTTLNKCHSSGNVAAVNCAGGIVGYVTNNSQISNCTSSANTGTQETSTAGGIVGVLDDNSSIANCHSSGNILGKNNIGGLTGEASVNTSINNSHFTGNASGTNNIGGIVGQTSGTNITNCYSTGEASGTNNIGGIVGYLKESSKVENCNASGNIAGNKQIGGLVGTTNKSNLNKCYYSGEVLGNKSTGGIAGFLYNSTINRCYAAGKVSGQEMTGGIAGHIFSNSVISNSYSINQITSMNNYVGGIAGYCFSNSKIICCHSSGNVKGQNYVGGITGYCSKRVQSSLSLHASISGTSDVKRVVGEKESSYSQIINSYALSNMKLNNLTVSSEIGSDNLNGANISQEDVKTKNWWTQTLHNADADSSWSNESIWDYTQITTNGYPSLK